MMNCKPFTLYNMMYIFYDILSVNVRNTDQLYTKNACLNRNCHLLSLVKYYNIPFKYDRIYYIRFVNRCVCVCVCVIFYDNSLI